MKEFNITGTCIPKKHYMVDMTHKLNHIKKLVDKEAYFTINRARQYGKTTTLSLLRRFLADDYIVIFLTFEGLGDASFKDEETFCQTLLALIYERLEFSNITELDRIMWKDMSIVNFAMLSHHITKMCRDKKIVLMIDEVDQVSNNRVFLNFLGILRKKFLARADEMDFTFHSVILAGVYDIRNVKLKLMNEGLYGGHQVEGNMLNSPWNIATLFEVEMSFSPSEIVTMLQDYEQDDQTGMEISTVATAIYKYTSGYPVLVSHICKLIHEKLEKNWTTLGVNQAVKVILEEKTPLFDSLAQNLVNNESVSDLIYDVLILGRRRNFSFDHPAIDLAHRYGFIVNVNGMVKLANKMFEMRMSNYFITKDEGRVHAISSGGLISEITRAGRFNMQLCLERFLIHWQEIYSEKQHKFYERECRMIFLTYLKPLLNGVGFYHIESALTDDRRMDLVVIYGKQRFVVELKTWKGKLYNDQGVMQLLGYMNQINENEGYLLTFDFRKQKEVVEPQWINHEGHKRIFEVRV